jgi:hypothetical protein|tara:strand:+ start:4102 stop:4371 length:270 start_codon:yes stop_codon:yes gene_type:complete
VRQQGDAENEVRTFEYNAKEGARLVIFLSLFRRALFPLLVFFLCLVFLATVTNGILAGLVSALVFAAPIVLILLVSHGQARKILDYWTK